MTSGTSFISQLRNQGDRILRRPRIMEGVIIIRIERAKRLGIKIQHARS